MRKTVIRATAIVVTAVLLLGSMITAVSYTYYSNLQKTIYAEVVDENNNQSSYMLKTQAVYLKDAMLTNSFATGKMGKNGYILKKIANVEVTENQRFLLYINSKITDKSVDKIKLSDKAVYKFTVVKK